MFKILSTNKTLTHTQTLTHTHTLTHTQTLTHTHTQTRLNGLYTKFTQSVCDEVGITAFLFQHKYREN